MPDTILALTGNGKCPAELPLFLCRDGLWEPVAVVAAVLTILALIKGVLDQVGSLRVQTRFPSISRLLSHWIKPVSYDDDQFYCADGVPADLVARRRRGLNRLMAGIRRRFPSALAAADPLLAGHSDFRFADANRVPFPFSSFMGKNFSISPVVTDSQGPWLRDQDGQRLLDVSGSYGVNVAGYERYKDWMQRGMEQVRDLGPVLGPVHPMVTENIDLLRKISGKDEVSFHMSGTEAVMAAVRLARFNRRRKLIVSFSGSYHGWWDGVQPGLGNERSITDNLVLREMAQDSLRLISRRSHRIAAILVNPLQFFHPNAPSPNDAALLTSEVRKTHDRVDAYAAWLSQLRELCDQTGIPLIFDEVYTGFRLAPGGAREFFNVDADLVVYGNTVGGGMPVGVVCGRKDLMRRLDPDRPMRFAFVVGTFSGHPAVMGAMNGFLKWVSLPETRELYNSAEQACSQWVRTMNKELSRRHLPVRLANFSTVWTMEFTKPGRYNWLLQYYLRATGIHLSFAGTGRCLSSLDFGEAEYRTLTENILGAVTTMNDDGWWPEQTSRSMKMTGPLLQEMLPGFFQIQRPLGNFRQDVRLAKEADLTVSNLHPVSQILHVISSSAFIVCYGLIFFDLPLAMELGLTALLVRQLGHAVPGPPPDTADQFSLAMSPRSKTVIVMAFLSIPLLVWLSPAAAGGLTPGEEVTYQWFFLSLIIVTGHGLILMSRFGIRASLIWLCKLVTDPLTDLLYYGPRYLKPLRTNLSR